MNYSMIKSYKETLSETMQSLECKYGHPCIEGLEKAVYVEDICEIKMAKKMNELNYSSNNINSMPTIVKTTVFSHGERKLSWTIYYSIELRDDFYYLNYLGSKPNFENNYGAVLDKYYLPKTKYRNAY